MRDSWGFIIGGFLTVILGGAFVAAVMGDAVLVLIGVAGIVVGQMLMLIGVIAEGVWIGNNLTARTQARNAAYTEQWAPPRNV